MIDQLTGAAKGAKASRFDHFIMVVLHIGLFLLAEVLTWNWTHSLSALQHRGLQTTAIITNMGMTTGRGSHPVIVYSYNTDQGKLFWRKNESVSSDDYARAHIGETVPIIFDPRSPLRARLIWHNEGPGGNYLAAFLLLTLVWIIIASFSFGLMWLGAIVSAD